MAWMGGKRTVRLQRGLVEKRTIDRQSRSTHKAAMDVFFEALFGWIVTKAGDRFGAWGVAVAVAIFLGAITAIFWWIFARP